MSELANTPAIIANLQLYYRFEDNLTDSSVNGRNGTFEGSGSAVYVPARYGKGLDLETDNSQRVNCNWNPNPGTGNFSLACWVKPESIAIGYGFITNYADKGGSDRDGFVIFRNGTYGGVNFGCYTDNVGDTIVGQIALVVGELFHIVAVRDDSYLHLYINGREDPGSPVVSNDRNVDSGSNMKIGDFYSYNIPGSHGCFDGVIDEAAYWSRALKLEEARQLYLDGAGALLGLV